MNSKRNLSLNKQLTHSRCYCLKGIRFDMRCISWEWTGCRSRSLMGMGCMWEQCCSSKNCRYIECRCSRMCKFCSWEGKMNNSLNLRKTELHRMMRWLWWCMRELLRWRIHCRYRSKARMGPCTEGRLLKRYIWDRKMDKGCIFRCQCNAEGSMRYIQNWFSIWCIRWDRWDN